jgi:hypothetical protein
MPCGAGGKASHLRRTVPIRRGTAHCLEHHTGLLNRARVREMSAGLVDVAGKGEGRSNELTVRAVKGAMQYLRETIKHRSVNGM